MSGNSRDQNAGAGADKGPRTILNILPVLTTERSPKCDPIGGLIGPCPGPPGTLGAGPSG